MKIVLEVSSGLFERVRAAVDHGNFRSIGEFTALALENQLSLESEFVDVKPSTIDLEESSDGGNGTRDERDSAATASENIRTRPRTTRVLPRNEASSLTVNEYGWLWGLINRILPIKFAARDLLESTENGPIEFELERKGVADRAARLAAELSRDSQQNRDRHETLITGFPIRQPLYPAKQRFSNHYFGRLEGSGQARGALFELGLAGIEQQGKETLVGLTQTGTAFAQLANPILDSETFNTGLSEAESSFYLQHIAQNIPRERDCLYTVLNSLRNGPLSVQDLDEVVRLHLPKRFSQAAIQTQKAGALGRLRDLGLIDRAKEGLTARFDLTVTGKEALSTLMRAFTETAQHQSAR